MESANTSRWTLFALAIVGCATVGLAPFTPQPHVVEKLTLLARGELTRAIDIGDLLLHGMPWLLLVFASLRLVSKSR